MAQFPSLIPSEAAITPGAWPATAHTSLNGSESRIRHGSAEIGRAWRPSFVNITKADYLAILAHYRGQRSGFDSFGFDTTTLAADLTPAGFAWLYASRPQVVDQHLDCFTVQCEFKCEPRGLAVAPGKAWRTGATVFTPGGRNGGAVYVAGASWATGSTTFTPGDRNGFYAVANGVNWATAATTFAPGTRTNGMGLRLLLHFNGSNGSTAFIDDSPSAHSMTVLRGTVAITTADSQFGGASGDFRSGGALRTPSSSAFTFPGDFAIELWAKRTGTNGSFDTLLSAQGSDGSDNDLMMRAGGDNPGFFIDGQQFASGFALTQDVWKHVAMVRSGSTVTAYLGGTSIGSTTNSSVITCGFLCLGDSAFAGSRYFKGFIDECRAKAEAVYTSNFTPPTAPLS